MVAPDSDIDRDRIDIVASDVDVDAGSQLALDATSASGAESFDGRAVAIDAAASVAARMVAMVASAVTAIVIAASLSKPQYGAYALASGLAGLLAVALDLGTTSSLARYLAQGRATPRLVALVVALRGSLLVVGALVLAAVSFGAGAHPSRFVELLAAAGVLLALQGMVAFLYGTLPSMRRIRLLLFVTVLQPVVELVFVLVAHAHGAGALGMLLAAAAGAAVAGLSGYVALAVHPRGMLPRDDQRGERVSLGNVVHYGVQLFLVLLLMMIFGQLDQFVIKAFHGDAAVAPYALVIKLQAMLVAPAITATSIVAPRIAGAGSAGAAMYRQWLAFFVVVQLGVCGMVAVVAPDLFAAINPDYRGDWGILLAMLPFLLLSGLATLPSVTMNQLGEARARQRIAIVAVLINVLVDLALVPSLDAYGAAIGTTVAYTWYVVMHHRLAERALIAQSVVQPPTMWPAVVRGSLLAIAAVAVGALVRPLVEGLADGRSGSLLVVALAGAAPGIVYLYFVTRMLRGGGGLTPNHR
ncbi:MAG: hypothetical protein JWN41_464 [Thermoleophilia bacterium]|nr:hypothetical protein [Thermoleophilia bacterium]